MTWHLSAETLRSYLTGAVPQTAAWSVEAHLTACERCRGLLAELSTVDQARRGRLDHGWATLAARLPPQGRARAGTRWRAARMLLAGGPAARWAWLVSCAVVLGLAAVLGAVASQVPWVGAVAPLVPVLGVAASYGSRLDAPREAIAATPAGGLRLLLLRAASVLAATIPIALAAGYASGYGSPVPWLLACLALTLATMALGTVLGIERAAVVLALGWVVAVGSALADPSWHRPVVLTGEAAPWMLALAAAAAVVVAARRESFNQFTGRAFAGHSATGRAFAGHSRNEVPR